METVQALEILGRKTYKTATNKLRAAVVEFGRQVAGQMIAHDIQLLEFSNLELYACKWTDTGSYYINGGDHPVFERLDVRTPADSGCEVTGYSHWKMTNSQVILIANNHAAILEKLKLEIEKQEQAAAQASAAITV